MSETRLQDLVIGIKGAGEMASAVAWRLFMSNLKKIFMMDILHPLAVRRWVSFSEAIPCGEQTVEGICAVRVSHPNQLKMAWEQGHIAVVPDPGWEYIRKIKPDVVVDAILAKRNLGTRRDDAPLVIGMGPGFNAGEDVDLVIETNRGHHLGRIISRGTAAENTGIPGNIGGYTGERVFRAPRAGVFTTKKSIGDSVLKGDVIGQVDTITVTAVIDGVIRGLIRSDTPVSQGLKLGDIDPRGDPGHCNTISDKARAISGSVLECILRTFLSDPYGRKITSQQPHLRSSLTAGSSDDQKSTSQISEIIEGIIRKDRRCISKAIRLIENEDENFMALIDGLFPYTGKAHRIGITGPPGAGKSTFISHFARRCRNEGLTVGIVAIDPSSPLSGGAILGDRLRMDDICLDPDIFIRSMSTRGARGGLTRHAVNTADIMDAAGKDIVIFETAGVGQTEIDVMDVADTLIVMITSDSGDIIQTLKSGLMEIGDIYVVNKADHPDAERMKSDLEYVLGSRVSGKKKTPVVRKTCSLDGTGIDTVFHDVRRCFQSLTDENNLQARRQLQMQKRVENLVNQDLIADFWDDRTQRCLRDLSTGIDKSSVYRLADAIKKHRFSKRIP